MFRPRLAGLLCLCFATAAAAPALAQRVDAKTSWQKHDAAIEYGPVKVGKHSLSEFQQGTVWRMGNNTASVFRLEMPIFDGDACLLPGSYRVGISRRGDDAFTLDTVGGNFGLGGVNDSIFPGKSTEAKPNDKLTLDWQADPNVKEAGPNKAMSLRIQFGPSVLTLPMLLLGGKPVDVPGYAVEVFTVPQELLEKRMGAGLLTPIATFTPKDHRDKKVPAAFNLLLGKSQATIQPQGVAPTDSYGFGEAHMPDAAYTRKGTATWTDAPETHTRPEAYLAPDKIERKDKHLHLVLACGKRVAEIDVADPLLTDASASAKTGSSH
jgi:hypothetical protein